MTARTLHYLPFEKNVTEFKVTLLHKLNIRQNFVVDTKQLAFTLHARDAWAKNIKTLTKNNSCFVNDKPKNRLLKGPSIKGLAIINHNILSLHSHQCLGHKRNKNFPIRQKNYVTIRNTLQSTEIYLVHLEHFEKLKD